MVEKEREREREGIVKATIGVWSILSILKLLLDIEERCNIDRIDC